jgi:hypothetical protein
VLNKQNYILTLHMIHTDGMLNRIGILSIPVFLILAWNLIELPRLSKPWQRGHESLSRQVGGTGLRHVTLGLRRTCGANVRDVRQDGSLTLHTSYSPLASWAVAVPLALGLPFNVSTRIPNLISMNLFFAGLWMLVRRLWGERAAAFALAYAAFCPFILFKYGLMTIFELLALGPLMVAAALLASEARGRWVKLGILVLSTISVLYSWIAWVVILPCAARESLIGRRRFGLMLASVTVLIPVTVHLTTIALAVGSLQGLVDEVMLLANHVRLRSSIYDLKGGPRVTHVQMARELANRCLRLVGHVPTVSSLILLARVAAGWDRWRSGFWVLLMFALGLPLSLLAVNIAYEHDFLIVTLIPALALSAAWVSVGPFADLEDRPRLALPAGLIVFAGFIYLDVLPNRHMARLEAEDIRAEQISKLIGQTIRPDDFVIVNRPATNLGWHRNVAPDLVELRDDEREVRSGAGYFSETMQAVFLATDTRDAARIATWARPGQRIVIAEVDRDLFELPPGFTPMPHSIERLLIGIKDPG